MKMYCLAECGPDDCPDRGSRRGNASHLIFQYGISIVGRANKPKVREALIPPKISGPLAQAPGPEITVLLDLWSIFGTDGNMPKTDRKAYGKTENDFASARADR